jgi:hypothetical protein
MSDLRYITEIVEEAREDWTREQRVADVVTIRRRGSQ